MKTIQLGQSDLRVTPICLGTMTFGEQVDEATAHAVLDRSLERGAVVKAYVVLAPDFVAARPMEHRDRAEFDRKLVAQLQAHVKERLAPYEYPKEIEFIDALPMTTTGKVQRRVLRMQEEARAAERGL